MDVRSVSTAIMPARKEKQLTIRSTEAYEIAHRLAKTLGKTTTEVVLMALRQYEATHAP
jgi:hypothetical protein